MKIHPEIITQKDKELINDLNYEGIKFPVLNNEFSKIEIKKKFFFVIKTYCLLQFTNQNKNLRIH